MLPIFFCFLACLLRQPAPVASVLIGYELGDPSNGVSILFPLSVTQCEPVVVFYNITTGDHLPLNLYPPDESFPFLTFTMPSGTGYLAWTCNVPAGKSFIASANDEHLYTVQSSTSSACLGDLSADTLVHYETNIFSSFTQHIYTAEYLGPFHATVNTYLSMPFPTITVNSFSGVPPATSTLPSPPSSVTPVLQGYQLGDPSRGINILFPLEVSQCEPVLIFYNITTGDHIPLNLYPPDESYAFLTFEVPSGTGYIEWTCIVPEKSSFIASSDNEYLYTVQAGFSSSCLGNLSVNTAVASLAMNIFSSFTQEVYTEAYLGPSPATLDAYFSMPFQTITANIPAISTVSQTSTSSVPPPTPSSGPSHYRKVKTAKIVGGTVGGVVFLVLIVYFVLRCRNLRACRDQGIPVAQDVALGPILVTTSTSKESFEFHPEQLIVEVSRGESSNDVERQEASSSYAIPAPSTQSRTQPPHSPRRRTAVTDACSCSIC